MARSVARASATPSGTRGPLEHDGQRLVETLPGIGPSAKKALAEHGIRTVADLVWVAPTGYDDLRSPVSLAAAVDEAKASPEGRGPRVIAAAIVKSASVVPIGRRRGVRVILVDSVDPTCVVHAFWFFLAQGILAVAKPDAPLLVAGRFVAQPKKPVRIAHPDLFPDGEGARVARPRYPKLGPPGAALRKAIQSAVTAGVAPDPVPATVAAREAMPKAAAVLEAVHATAGGMPTDDDRATFVARLAWAEAFTRVCERMRAEAELAKQRSVALPTAKKAVDALVRELGFTLTADQKKAIADVAADLASDRPMRRLLLGDVGTGKTAVALAAVAQCLAAGKQAAILAPTSVLAEQYQDAALPLVRAAKITPAFVVAGLPAAERRRAEAALADGTARLAIGTHALLEEGVTIPDLALVVVDEQQRLGVAQRLAMVRKGSRPHLLTLSATPIPRTLSLAVRGELATTVLRERPRGRAPVATELAPMRDEAAVIARVRETCARGERVFWVVPRVEESDDEDADVDPIASAAARAAKLTKALARKSERGAPARCGILHGKMKPEEKRAVMRDFRSGAIDVLVATTVIEVGVDVPAATLIVVENAEQFGLAALHQLRGRVGRGERPGTCVLLHADVLDALARARLDALVAETSGEGIAKRDLALRGAGDLTGTRQAGREEEGIYLTSDVDYPWLPRIEGDVRALLADDPLLERPEHLALGSLVRRLARAFAIREEAG